ncbi:ARCA-like protein [Fusarium napiforme]|uniref:ARCA-like protein n=1 Tax=Fusarium napiforme TaxID=42672 RepID=A0A8H5MX98_9HYPO|nr:ARCA-like protein [Fusarium napiforme]
MNTATACLACKKQHLKCVWGPQVAGGGTQTCLRCVSMGKVCATAPVFRFKHSTTSSSNQVWVPCSRRRRQVQFVDETPDVEGYYLSDSESHSHWQQVDGNTFQSHGEQLPDFGPSASPTSHTSAVEICGGDGASANQYPTPWWRTMKSTWGIDLWQFDLCDSRRHFANIVPPRAASCPTLLNAIFALSSRHLSLNAQYDPYASDRYHQACLRHLATISNDSSALNDDNLLAATILLRTLEELDVPLIGTDHEGHLLGIQLFMNTCDSTTTPSSLRLASFWIGMRQEVTMSFASQRPVKIRLDHGFMDRSLSEADDDTWANRIIVHSADVINYCFGNNDPNKHHYQELVDYDQAWLRARPVSWLPVAYSASDEASGEAFPHIIYLNHAVVIGQVHSIFARILLMCHDDRVPRIGPSAQLARKQIDVG